ncbi:MAG: hypothetical protein ACWA44_02375 [Thiotrichales bacterium]
MKEITTIEQLFRLVLDVTESMETVPEGFVCGVYASKDNRLAIHKGMIEHDIEHEYVSSGNGPDFYTLKVLGRNVILF